MTKLPEAVHQQVAQRLTALLTEEVQGIMKLVYEIAYAQGAKDVKTRIVKHCDERAAWLESQRSARPTEDWGVKKSELEHLGLELRGFAEEPQG